MPSSWPPRTSAQVAEAELSAGPVAVELEQGQRVEIVERPVAAAGVYAPGGRVAYPSSVLMCCVPARAAGVERVALATPPEPDGSVGCGHARRRGDRRRRRGVRAGRRARGRRPGARHRDDRARRRGRGPRQRLGHRGQAPALRHRGCRRARRPHRAGGRAGRDGRRRRGRARPARPGRARGRQPAARGLVELGCARRDRGANRRRPLASGRAWQRRRWRWSRRPRSMRRSSSSTRSRPSTSSSASRAPTRRSPGSASRAACSSAPGGGAAFGDYAAGSNHVLPTGGAARFGGPLGARTFMRRTSVVTLDRKAREGRSRRRSTRSRRPRACPCTASRHARVRAGKPADLQVG